jgi:aryl-alcohol dehydrogenase-like predicted oxidoreductase
MRYKLLGRSGLRVSELGLGAMIFGAEGNGGARREDCGRIVEAFAEAGGNFIDTADAYGSGTSERIVGELVAAERDSFVLATKYTLSRDPRDPNAAGNHRKSLVHALDGSLERLRTDYVDLLWVHIGTSSRRSRR